MEYSIGGFEAERRGFIAWNASDLFLAWLSRLPIFKEAEATRELQPG
jgi:hypothetical protein